MVNEIHVPVSIIRASATETPQEIFERTRAREVQLSRLLVFFVEGQNPRGIFVLCKGRVKLTLSSSTGKTLIMKLVEPGEVLGLSATISGKPYEVMAETAEPCQINFVQREDFLRFLRQHNEAGLRVAEQLSDKYNSDCREIRALSLSHSAGEKVAKLLLDWSARTSRSGKADTFWRLMLTHE